MNVRSLGLMACVTFLLACGGASVAPEADDPEVVMMEGTLANRYVVAGQVSEVISRLRIDTRALEGVERPPINLALVVDTSGSMDGDPISHARHASLSLLDVLHPEDRLSVVAFHSETEVLLESTQIGSAEIPELRERIGQMEARGTTDLAGGVQAGLEELVRHFEPEGVNRLVLLSDGVPNDPSGILALATAAGERGIRITALGLGDDYDETLLGQVAQQSGGRFHYVSEASAVAGVFRDEVLRFERLLARNVVLELRPGPGVQIDSVLGQPTTASSAGAVRVSLGDVSEGEHRDVVIRMRAAARRPGASVELMDAVLSFDDAIQDAGRLERRVFLGARATGSQEDLEAGRDVEVERAAARMVAAVTTVQAIERARSGRVEEARAILNQAAREAEMAAAGDAELESQAGAMRDLGPALASVAPAPAMDAPMAPSDDVAGADAPSMNEEPSIAPGAPARVRAAHSSAMEMMQAH
ncbi:MAG: VWA domain-containing protein [Sandaracinaceae bacterium]